MLPSPFPFCAVLKNTAAREQGGRFFKTGTTRRLNDVRHRTDEKQKRRTSRTAKGGKNLFPCPIKRRARDSPTQLGEKQTRPQFRLCKAFSKRGFPQNGIPPRIGPPTKKHSLSATFHETADRRYKSDGEFYLTSNAKERYCLRRRDLSDEKILSSIRRNVSSKAACNPHRNDTEPRKIPDSALIL